MTAMIDETAGRPAIAYVGETPWHGLGQQLTPGADLTTWQTEAGLDWSIIKAPVKYSRPIIDPNTAQMTAETTDTMADRVVLYRSDTGAALSVASPKYNIVQPGDVIEFYRDLTEKMGFRMEVAGALSDGKRVWALANCNEELVLPGKDAVNCYMLLATSCDGTMSTRAMLTSVRVVCNNTLQMAMGDHTTSISVPHSTKFNAQMVKDKMGVYEAWERFTKQSSRLAQVAVSEADVTRFVLNLYHGLDTDAKIEEAMSNNIRAPMFRRTIDRLQDQLANAPGADLPSANGTLWGLVNAITHDVDFEAPAKTQNNRLQSAWFGRGSNLKARALSMATALAA